MSEIRSHFKIRSGEIEIEYGGPVEEVNQRYKEAFEWIKSNPKIDILKKGRAKEETVPEDKKKTTHGREIWSPAIDALISEDFFKLPARRTTTEVLKALEDKALPTQGKSHNISVTLTRKVRRGNLKGTKGPDGWIFWTE